MLSVFQCLRRIGVSFVVRFAGPAFGTKCRLEAELWGCFLGPLVFTVGPPAVDSGNVRHF
jgi:hypothetical protein